jgi:hypothetical protein
VLKLCTEVRLGFDVLGVLVVELSVLLGVEVLSEDELTVVEAGGERLIETVGLDGETSDGVGQALDGVEDTREGVELRPELGPVKRGGEGDIAQ